MTLDLLPVLGNIRLAHSGSMDEVDAKMRDARLALEEVRADLKERRLRWHHIELSCGVSFTAPPDAGDKQTMARSASVAFESNKNLSTNSLASLATKTSLGSGGSVVGSGGSVVGGGSGIKEEEDDDDGSTEQEGN